MKKPQPEQELKKITAYLQAKDARINKHPHSNGISFFISNKSFAYGGVVRQELTGERLVINTEISGVGRDISIRTQIFTQYVRTFKEFVELHKNNCLLEGKFEF